jgi:uncharacterized protein (TIGR03437 family)
MVSRKPSLVLLAGTLLSCVSLGNTQTVRIKQNDPSIAYTGTWYTNNSASNFGGIAALTNFKGATAVLSFNGTGVTWIGVLDPGNGIAYVYLDGQLTTVDCYGASTAYQQQMFAAHNLTAGPHTLSIEVPHIRDANGSGSWVWIDSFLVENGTGITGGVAASPGLVTQANPALTYTGVWFTNTSVDPSVGTAMLSTDSTASVSINFNGVGVTWLAYRDQWSGIATVALDGAMQATVDTYDNPAQSQSAVYSISGLPLTTHTLTIQVTGTHDANSADSWVWLDAFEVLGPSGAAPAIFKGGVVSGASYSGNSVTPGQIVSIFGSNFLGTGQAQSTAVPLATQLGASNASVTACGENIPLFVVVPGQINAQVPWECPTTGSVQMTVTANGQTSASQTVNLAAASPGIFTQGASSTGNGAILHANNSLVTPASPAQAGETVVVYCTGLGPTSPAFATGTAALGANQTVNPVTASIGGQAASVVYSGMAAGFVGLYQVNVVVPAGLSGSQAVLIAVEGLSSQVGVTIFVNP